MKIISIAPTRLSLFGGGTDVEPYASTYGGVCINMAINLRQYITLGDVDYEIPKGASENFYQAFFDEFDIEDIGMSSGFDGIIESGLGSSASAAVALIGALGKYTNTKMALNEIAEKAWDIEVNKLELFGGKQDQYAAAYGGMNLWKFNKKVERIPFSSNIAKELSEYILLFYTGENRKESKIQEELKNPSYEQKLALDGIKKTAIYAQELIALKKWDKVGDLLDRAWEFKKLSNKKMTNKKIDNIYDRALALGAWGGKLCGSGGGGHMFFMADKQYHSALIKGLERMGAKHIDFSIDFSGLEVRQL